MDPSRITMLCFAASYALALGLEMSGVAARLGRSLRRGRRALSVGLLIAGLTAHLLYLVLRAAKQAIPLSSPADWCQLAAFVLALFALGAILAQGRWAVGVFLLPVVLALVGAARLASSQPFTVERASGFWGMLHGGSLLIATVVVSVGFVAGVLYLWQSERLKRKLAPDPGFRLPSLEWLERINGRALAVSTWFVAVGFGSGIVLGQIRNRGVMGYSYLTDPAVWSLGTMLGWLLLAELFRTVYPAARRGKKVAYLTVASFVLLVVMIASVTMQGMGHGAIATQEDAQGEMESVQTVPLTPGLPIVRNRLSTLFVYPQR